MKKIMLTVALSASTVFASCAFEKPIPDISMATAYNVCHAYILKNHDKQIIEMSFEKGASGTIKFLNSLASEDYLTLTAKTQQCVEECVASVMPKL